MQNSASILALRSQESTKMCLLQILTRKKISLQSQQDSQQTISSQSDLSSLTEDLNLEEDLTDLLLQYENLDLTTQTEIEECHLDLEPALQRCNSQLTKIGSDQECIKITPTYVGRNCPDEYIRLGCCRCVRQCPGGS